MRKEKRERRGEEVDWGVWRMETGGKRNGVRGEGGGGGGRGFGGGGFKGLRDTYSYMSLINKHMSRATLKTARWLL